MALSHSTLVSAGGGHGHGVETILFKSAEEQADASDSWW